MTTAAASPQARILRSLFLTDIYDAQVTELIRANLTAFEQRPFAWAIDQDREIHGIVRDIFAKDNAPPMFGAIEGVLKAARNDDGINRLNRLALSPIAVRSEFIDLLAEVHKENLTKVGQEIYKTAALIQHQPTLVGQGRDAVQLHGPLAAADWATQQLSQLQQLARSSAPKQETFGSLDKVQMKRVEWLYPGVIPVGRFGLLEGGPNAGKSTVARDWAARVSTGLPWPGEDPEGPWRAPANVLWITSEESIAEVLAPRLAAAGADMSRVTTWLQNDQWTVGKLKELVAHIEETKPALVIMDLLKPSLGLKSSKEDWSDISVGTALHPLEQIAIKYRAAIIGVRHWKKGTGPALERGGGSTKYAGSAQYMYCVGKHDGRLYMACVRNKLSSPPPTWEIAIESAYIDIEGQPSEQSRIAWLGVSDDVSADDLSMALPQSREDKGSREEAEEFLRGALEHGPRSAKDVLREGKQMGISEVTLKRAKEEIAKSTKEGMGGGWLWELRSDEADAQPRTPRKAAPVKRSMDPELVDLLGDRIATPTPAANAAPAIEWTPPDDAYDLSVLQLDDPKEGTQ